jgi:regulator of protease activity HflC (stomatin/prohibitin superfamily)
LDNLPVILAAAIVIVIAAAVAMSVRRVAPDERIIVERFGMHTRTAGPGWTLIVPVIERGIRVRLAESMPAWQAYPEDQLLEKLVADHYRSANLPD